MRLARQVVVLVVTLVQRASTDACNYNHYAATGAVGRGGTMHAYSRTCGIIFSCHFMSSDVLSRPSVAFCAQRSQWRPSTACFTDTHRRPGTKFFSTCTPTNLLLWRVRIVGSITIQTSWPRRLLLTRQSSNTWSISAGGYGPCLACKITEAAMVATGAKDVARMCYRAQSLPCMFNY